LLLLLLLLQVLIFVNGIEGGMRLRLFLESFGLRLGCVHAQLPVNSRSHILAAFNKGLFDILIATGKQPWGGGMDNETVLAFLAF
jgi:ATP-dependent RNA helicase DDX56/DBP9